MIIRKDCSKGYSVPLIVFTVVTLFGVMFFLQYQKRNASKLLPPPNYQQDETKTEEHVANDGETIISSPEGTYKVAVPQDAFPSETLVHLWVKPGCNIPKDDEYYGGAGSIEVSNKVMTADVSDAYPYSVGEDGDLQIAYDYDNIDANIPYSVIFPLREVPHIDMETLAVWWCDTREYAENPTYSVKLPAEIDPIERTIKGSTIHMGTFGVLGEKICKNDVSEPDGEHPNWATLLDLNKENTAVRYFDIENDSDWFKITIDETGTYLLEAINRSEGTSAEIKITEVNGAFISSNTNSVTTELNKGSYFVEVAPSFESKIGCDSQYTIRFSTK